MLRANVVFVAKARALFGDKDVTRLLLRVNDEGFCHSTSELAINGKDLLALGFEGKELGKMLDRLFDAVIDDPSKNTRPALMLLAKQNNQ